MAPNAASNPNLIIMKSRTNDKAPTSPTRKGKKAQPGQMDMKTGIFLIKARKMIREWQRIVRDIESGKFKVPACPPGFHD
jgi:hypothetical protein